MTSEIKPPYWLIDERGRYYRNPEAMTSDPRDDALRMTLEYLLNPRAVQMSNQQLANVIRVALAQPTVDALAAARDAALEEAARICGLYSKANEESDIMVEAFEQCAAEIRALKGDGK